MHDVSRIHSIRGNYAIRINYIQGITLLWLLRKNSSAFSKSSTRHTQLRPKDKTYNFQLRNLFRCGECGFAITAEQKQKTIKSTGEIREYVYYHCTGKNKNIKCTQPKLHVNEDVLIEQIKDKLNKFTIDPDFYKLAIEALAQEEDEVVEKIPRTKRQAQSGD